MKQNLLRLLAVALLLGSWTHNAAALGESSARALGMGGTFTAVARNLSAVGWNPANLAFPTDVKLRIAIFSGGGGVGNDAFAVKDYNRWNGAHWNDADKTEILSRVPAEGLTLNTAAEARAFGLSYGNFAFRAVSFGSVRGRLPKDPVDLILFGNEASRTYRIDDAEAKGQAIWSLSVSGAHQIRWNRVKRFSIGATARLLRGIGYFEAKNVSGQLVTSDAGLILEGSAEARRAEGGSGFSLDLGLAAGVSDLWSVGVSVVQIGKMSWSKDARELSGSIRTDSLKVEDLVEVEEFNDLFNPTDNERVVDSFSAVLPTTLRVGAARTSGRSVLAFDWEQGLNNGPGATTKARLSMGGEYKLTPWLPLRAGVSLGGRIRRAYTVGFGLGEKRVAFDLALRVRKGIVLNGAVGLGVSTELRLGF